LWSNGTKADLRNNFSPAAINHSGVIVGGQLVYSGATLQNLNTLISAGSPLPDPKTRRESTTRPDRRQRRRHSTGQDHGLLLTRS